jgi:hypothetical protein
MPVAQGSPLDADATRARHFRTLASDRGAIYSIAILGSAGFLFGASRGSVALMVGIPLAVIVLTLAIAFKVADGRAADDLFAAFARDNGLRQRARVVLAPLTPLLGAGDRRYCEHYMEGPLPGRPGVEGGLGLYTFEVKKRSGDGNRSHWVSRDFTVCVVDVEDAMSEFPGIYLRRRVGVLDHLGVLVEGGGWPDNDGLRAVDLESATFDDTFDLRVVAEQDDGRLHELFTPRLINWLTDHPLRIQFEYRAGALVVYLDGDVADTGRLVHLFEAGGHLAAAIAGEWREAQAAAGT